jgi:hypothetical protein
LGSQHVADWLDPALTTPSKPPSSSMVANVARINDHKKRHFEKLRQIIANAATWLPHISCVEPDCLRA